MATSDTIAFAEKLLLLLDQGAYTATYKVAVLLGLIDVCLEQTSREGKAPRQVACRDLARRVVELYWPQTRPFRGEVVLRQNSTNQAAVVRLVREFREALGPMLASPGQAEILNPDGFRRLLHEVEWKLVQMPLPRLQVIGREEERFIYDLSWVGEPTRSSFTSGELDTTIRLRSGVGENLVRLSGLLRPLIQKEWTDRVARFNRGHVEEGELEGFLFGVPRTPPARLRSDLVDLQEGSCFYCRTPLTEAVEVDHFVPWARHPDDGIHNLVVADRRCNNSKRHFLAATRHVERWKGRADDHGTDLDEIAAFHQWPRNATRTGGAARAIYLRLREDARLWLERGAFEAPDLGRLSRILSA